MVDPKLLPTGFEVTAEDLQHTPLRVQRLLIYLRGRIQILEAENVRLKKASGDSGNEIKAELH